MASGVSKTTEQIARQQAGRFLTWIVQESGSTATNTSAVAVNVSGRQVGKICVATTGTLDIHLVYKYEGDTEFYNVDGSERTISENWTQQCDISGVVEMYVAVTAYISGSFTIKFAVAEEDV